MEFHGAKCVGIMGGTFNPIHNGHVLMAKSAYEQFEDMELVVFMPNNLPKYKNSAEIIDSEHRMNMLHFAVEQYQWARVSDMEIKRGGITYTYDTLSKIKKDNPGMKIYFIIGTDSLKSFTSWFRYRDVLDMCTLLVAGRDNGSEHMKELGKRLIDKCECGHIEYICMKEYDAASSDIRVSIKEGLIPETVLDKKVVDYIKSNRLYGWK